MTYTCRYCAAAFEISDADLAFYDKVSPVIGGITQSIPPPTLCPGCRRIRRMTWRNERSIHRNICAFSGKQILSIYRQQSPYKVYEHSTWNSDAWDGVEYGRSFDFSRPFFAQFDELNRAVPQLSMNLQAGNINCDFCNLVTGNKNCYFTFAANGNEDVYYANYMHDSTDCVDCFFLVDGERCYECVDCQRCTRLLFSRNCEQCVESSYLEDCSGCTNCFACAGLRKKEHCFLNESLSKDAYEERLRQLRADPALLPAILERWRALQLVIPHKHLAGMMNERSTGDHLLHCRNVLNCYDCKESEDCQHCTWLHRAKDCHDCYAWGMTGELGYENHLCGNGFYGLRFCDSCWNAVRDLLYCRLCISCSDCFGCVGLKRKRFCVFNKQYTEEDYAALVPRIIERMRSDGEYGEFFPSHISPFPYNDTLAQDYAPLTREELAARGWAYQEDDLPKGRETTRWPDIPFSIADVPDAITDEILACTACDRNFRIIPQELSYYRSMNLPLPQRCFDCRYRARRDLRNPRTLWGRQCAKCGKEIQTTYAPDRPEIVYCESCYLQTVY